MSSFLVSAKTNSSINELIDIPPHALIITGKAGSGREELTREVIARILGISGNKVSSYQYYLLINSQDGKSISVEQMREVKDALKLKLPGDYKGMRRFVVIKAFEGMAHVAQNSILKFIEEPPIDTMIILLVNNESELLATIRSRSTILNIIEPDFKEVSKYLSDKSDYDPNEIKRVYALSDGRVGLMLALLNDTNHKLVSAIKDAKLLLASDKYNRLLKINELYKDREKVEDILFALNQLASYSINNLAKSKENINRWRKTLDALSEAEYSMRRNVNVKLLLIKLMLAM